MKRVIFLLTAIMLLLTAGCQPAAQPTPSPETMTPPPVETPAMTDAPTEAGDVLDMGAQLDLDVPTNVRNVAVKLAVVKDEATLVSYVFGADVKNTNVSEDVWDDNGVVTVKAKMWEMKDPDDMRWLETYSTGNLQFDRQVEPPASGLTVTVERARELLTAMLGQLGLPAELGAGEPTVLPEGWTLEEAGLYPEFLFRLNDVEGMPISQNCALNVTVSSDGESIISFYACLVESARPVGETLTLITPKQAADVIASTLGSVIGLEGSIPIDQVRLCYDLRRVRGMADTGLLVPVWEFEGPEGDMFIVDAVTGAILGGFSEEVVADPAQVQ